MDKTTIKAFIAWLETASEEEIEAKRRELANSEEALINEFGTPPRA